MTVPENAALAQVTPIERPQSLRVHVQHSLAQLISIGTLPPGMHLKETEIAKRFAVSRIPVREALLGLETDGWVELRQGRGAFVRQPTEKEAQDDFDARVMLETETARLAALHTDAASIARLRDICQAGIAAWAGEDPHTVSGLNAQLHSAVAAMSGNDTLVRLVTELERKVSWYFSTITPRRGRVAWDEHLALVTAIERGDSAAAAAIMHAHVRANASQTHHEHQ